MNKLPWFTHDHDAHEDEFIQQLMDRFGHFGYAGYFILLELIHKHGTGGILKMSRSRLVMKLRSRWPQTQLLLDFCRLSDKVQFTLIGDEVEFQNKKFIERQRKLKFNAPSMLHQRSVNAPKEREREGERDNDSVAQQPRPVRVKREKATKHPTEALRQVVAAYLQASGKGQSEIAQDPGGWGRWMLEADRLLLELAGRVDLAVECIQDRAKDWSGVADWTLVRVAVRAKDWLAFKQAQVARRPS